MYYKLLYDGAVSHFVQDKLVQRPTRTKTEKLICTRLIQTEEQSQTDLLHNFSP